MNEITSRVVRRWFVNGKGFANRYNAARYVAKLTLTEAVGKLLRADQDKSWLDEDGGWRRIWREAYAEFFKDYPAVPMRPGNRNYQGHLTEDGNEKYHHWLETETRRIMETL